MSEQARRRALATWEVEGPTKRTEDGATWYELRVRGLHDFFVAAETIADLWKEYPLALESFLDSFVGRGEAMPAPAPRLEWVMTPQVRRERHSKDPVTIAEDGYQTTATATELAEVEVAA